MFALLVLARLDMRLAVHQLWQLETKHTDLQNDVHFIADQVLWIMRA